MLSSKSILVALTVSFLTIVSVNVTADDAKDSEILKGRYLIDIAGCHGCHTLGYALTGGNVPEDEWLLGVGIVGFRGAWGTTYPSNIRTNVNKFTKEQWVQYAKNMQTRPPMPWLSMNAMTESDLSAIYEFVKSLGEGTSEIPDYVPVDGEPTTITIDYPMAIPTD